MPYVDDADVQIHLPIDKINFDEIPDDKVKAVEDSDRTIRGYLNAVLDSDVLDTWVTPDDTPPEIRAIGGRLTAALIYRDRYSEDSLDDPQFAQNKYNEAMAMLQAIIVGEIVITGVTDVTTGFDDTWFLPNDSTVPPFFTMGARF